MIIRKLEESIRALAGDGKAIILIGPRQVGKTTLLKTLTKGKNVLWLDADDSTVRGALSNPNEAMLRVLIGEKTTLVIDEAQRVDNIGLAVKILVDQFQGLQVYVSGSSAFEISNKLNEPLTGRKWELQLFPFTFSELTANNGYLEEISLLPHRLVFGTYPEVVNHANTAKQRIQALANSYLYKDIFAIDEIKKSEKFQVLLKSLAFQIGQQVSYNELAKQCGLDVGTVERYIHVLEKAFVIFRIPSFQRNLRNELKKSKKIYFVDNGIRNAVIEMWQPLDARTDKGALWENFLMSERWKKHHYEQSNTKMYFWRTTAQQEIDLIEEENGELRAYEFKYSPTKSIKLSSTFLSSYNPAVATTIHSENLFEFLLNEKVRKGKKGEE
jgi:predicted AAA+ superfamily ATPase